MVLRDVRLDTEVINAELGKLGGQGSGGAPLVRVSAATLSTLTVHISYSKLLTESCKFVVDEVLVELCAVEADDHDKHYNSSHDKKQHDETNGVPADPAPHSNNEESAGAREDRDLPTQAEESPAVSFVANWIDIVTSKLQVQADSLLVLRLLLFLLLLLLPLLLLLLPSSSPLLLLPGARGHTQDLALRPGPGPAA